MALESEYVPERTSRLSALPPDDRRVYKTILWGLIGSYVAVVIIMGAVVVNHIDSQKAADLVVARTSAH